MNCEAVLHAGDKIALKWEAPTQTAHYIYVLQAKPVSYSLGIELSDEEEDDEKNEDDTVNLNIASNGAGAAAAAASEPAAKKQRLEPPPVGPAKPQPQCACPACTFLNDAAAVACTICAGSLASASGGAGGGSSSDGSSGGSRGGGGGGGGSSRSAAAAAAPSLSGSSRIALGKSAFISSLGLGTLPMSVLYPDQAARSVNKQTNKQSLFLPSLCVCVSLSPSSSLRFACVYVCLHRPLALSVFLPADVHSILVTRGTCFKAIRGCSSGDCETCSCPEWRQHHRYCRRLLRCCCRFALRRDSHRPYVNSDCIVALACICPPRSQTEPY